MAKKIDPSTLKPATPYQLKRVELPKLTRHSIVVHIKGRGDSPLVMNTFHDQIIEDIAGTQGGKAKEKKAPRVPEEVYERARLRDAQGRDCIRIDALKKSMIRASTMMGEKMTEMRMAFFIVDPSGELKCPITYDSIRMRSDNVRISSGATVAHRPEFRGWRASFTIEFFPGLITVEKILKLIDCAGWSVGIHEGRPEKTSALSWGRFELDAEKMLADAAE